MRCGQWFRSLVGLVGVILLGTLDAALPVVQGLVITIVALLWGAVRVMEARVGTHSITTESSQEATRRLRWYRVRTGATILAVAALAAGFTGPLLMPGQPRTVLRETVVPPFDIHEYTSPLVGFRNYKKEVREEEMFKISELPENGRIRLATLDRYDGVVYDASGDGGVTGVYTRVGDEIATGATAKGTPTSVDITVTDIAASGSPRSAASPASAGTAPNAAAQMEGTYYNSDTHTAITTAGIRPGDTYTLNTLVTEEPSEETLKKSKIDLDVELPETDASGMPRGAAGQDRAVHG